MEFAYAVVIVIVMFLVFWVLTTPAKSSLVSGSKMPLVRPQDVSYTHEQSLFSGLFGQELTMKGDPYAKM